MSLWLSPILDIVEEPVCLWEPKIKRTLVVPLQADNIIKKHTLSWTTTVRSVRRHLAAPFQTNKSYFDFYCIVLFYFCYRRLRSFSSTSAHFTRCSEIVNAKRNYQTPFHSWESLFMANSLFYPYSFSLREERGALSWKQKLELLLERVSS